MNFSKQFLKISLTWTVTILFGSALFGQPGTEGDYLTEAERCRHSRELIKALEAVFPGSDLKNNEAVKYINAYLQDDGVSLDRYIGVNTKGAKAFWKLKNQIDRDSAIVLGTPGDIVETKRLIEDAQERMSIKREDGKEWQFYTCESLHQRRAAGKLGRIEHAGVVNFVRVTLPKLKADEKTISTPLGEVHPHDHLFFSNEQLRNYYFNLCYPNGPDSPGVSYYKKLPAFERVDLVTPARYNLVRFAPLAIFMVYAKADDKEPIFYMMEGGNGLGFCEVIYISPTMDPRESILMNAGYRPTSFSNSWNYYLAKTLFKKDHPVHVSIKIYTRKEAKSIPFSQMGRDSAYHFDIKMNLEQRTLAQVADTGVFIHPAKQVFEAFLRIEELKDMGVPQTSNTDIEKKYTCLTQRITRRASAGKDVTKDQEELRKVEAEMSEELNPK